MVKQFDSDVAGAVLEFFALFGAKSPQARQAWESANLKNPTSPSFGYVTTSQVWIGPAVCKAHLLGLLEVGRNRAELRRKLDRVFLALENRLLIEPFGGDDNLRTQYRIITELGRELLEENAYLEYLFGLEEVVRRWKNSVVKIYSPTASGIGSGFLIAPTIVATARHVVDDLNELELAFEVTVHGGWPATVPHVVTDRSASIIS